MTMLVLLFAALSVLFLALMALALWFGDAHWPPRRRAHR